jgi:hypothetical protein
MKNSFNLNLEEVLQSTYKSKDQSAKVLKEHGYQYDNELSNINERVYYHPEDKKLLITSRGTTNWLNDLPTDFAILTGTLKNTSRYKHAEETYSNAKIKYNKSDYLELE